MGRGFLLAVCLCMAVSGLAAAPPQAQQSDFYYIYKNGRLETAHGDPSLGRYSSWQVWLYPQSVDVSRFPAAGLAYARWGVIEGPSAKVVSERLAAEQEFEHTYAALFGQNSWGRFTFSYPVGPIAVPQGQPEMNPSELVSDINVFNNRLVSVIEALRPSLEMAQSREAVSPFKDYLDQVRYCLEQVSRFYDQLSRVPEQPAYLSQELSRLGPAVSAAEDGVSRIRAILPSVKLPTDKAWVTHVEQQGNEGIVKVTISCGVR